MNLSAQKCVKTPLIQALSNFKYTNLSLRSLIRNHLRMSLVHFSKKNVWKFLNIALISQDWEIFLSLSTSSGKGSIWAVIYKVTLPLFSRFFNFKKFCNDLDMDVFVINPASLPLNVYWFTLQRQSNIGSMNHKIFNEHFC